MRSRSVKMSSFNVIDETKIELEEVPCAICGGRNLEHYLTTANIRQGCKKRYNLDKCKDCGLIFLNPRPTKDSIMAYYLDSDKEKLPEKPKFYEKVYFNLFRRIPYGHKGVLLDVGCGSGKYIYVLRSKGWNTKGVDIAFTDYGRQQLGLDIYEGNLLEAKFPSESFDVVTFWWALEHIYSPLDTLKETYRILKRKGLVIIGVPNIASLEARIFGPDWFHLFVPKHLYQFSPHSLKTLLGNAGFSDIDIRYDPFSFGIIGSLQCRFNRYGLKISLNNPLFYILSLPIDVILGIARVGGLITAYAYKK